ncbi:hypothetical protein EVAR_93267_1 [Eumeta japonica]|uniref:Uncharacterized protein n=1 Tax=Eumeta variegata TaxID=151549 RepID=A0A4C1TY44_EUMVA|nr:hypothetical protein EVAR_93267_1 [Eumeta japonica]
MRVHRITACCLETVLPLSPTSTIVHRKSSYACASLSSTVPSSIACQSGCETSRTSRRVFAHQAVFESFFAFPLHRQFVVSVPIFRVDLLMIADVSFKSLIKILKNICKCGRAMQWSTWLQPAFAVTFRPMIDDFGDSIPSLITLLSLASPHFNIDQFIFSFIRYSIITQEVGNKLVISPRLRVPWVAVTIYYGRSRALFSLKNATKNCLL